MDRVFFVWVALVPFCSASIYLCLGVDPSEFNPSANVAFLFKQAHLDFVLAFVLLSTVNRQVNLARLSVNLLMEIATSWRLRIEKPVNYPRNCENCRGFRWEVSYRVQPDTSCTVRYPLAKSAWTQFNPGSPSISSAALLD